MKDGLALNVAEQFYFRGLIPYKRDAYKKIVYFLIINVIVWMDYLLSSFKFVEKVTLTDRE